MIGFWFNIKNKQEVYGYLNDKLNINFLMYTHNDYSHEKMNICESEDAFYIDQPIESILSDIHHCIPIDKPLIDNLKESEIITLDLIYRWRSSLLNKVNYQNMRNLYYDLIRYWNHYLKSNSINLVLISDIPHSIHEYVVYILAKARNIPTIIIQHLPLLAGNMPTLYYSSSLNEIYDGFENHYNDLIKKYSEDPSLKVNLPIELENYFIYYRSKNFDHLKASGGEVKFNILDDIIERALVYIRQRKFKILFKKIPRIFLLNYRRKKLKNILSKFEKNIIENEKFFFFPLHLQPEASTMPNAGLYSKLDLIINLVSKSIPKGYKLYIKEHPTYFKKIQKYDNVFDHRSYKYYKEISKLDNVRILDHKLKSRDLIQQSVAIVTATGTAGWEALFLGKPVITFGENLYSKIKGVHYVDGIDKFNQVISEIVDDASRTSSDKDLKLFLKALDSITVNATTDYDYIRGINSLDITREVNDLRVAKGIISFIKIAYPSVNINDL